MTFGKAKSQWFLLHDTYKNRYDGRDFIGRDICLVSSKYGEKKRNEGEEGTNILDQCPT